MYKWFNVMFFVLLVNHCDVTSIFNCNKNTPITKPVNSTVKFYCFNNKTIYEINQLPRHEVFLFDPNITQKINFKKNVTFITHGWTQLGNESWLADIASAWIKFSDVNVCIVDWGISSNFNYLNCTDTIQSAFEVAYYLKELISYLIKYGVDIKNINIAGHSVGAHIAGITSYLLNNEIGWIYGLDPSSPCFIIPLINSECRLDETDANWVQVIHTNAYILGSGINLGHQDFYVNGGIIQTACHNLEINSYYDLLYFFCYHFESVRYFFYSFNSDCIGTVCKSFIIYELDGCKSNPTDLMGPRNKKIPGTFYLNTNDIEPYCKN